MFKPTQNDTGLKAVTVDRIYGNLRTIFNSAVRVGIMKENPLKRCTPLKINKFDTEKKALDTQQAKQFLELLEDEKNSNLKCAMFVGLFCGLRSGEMRALHWDDIDLEKELIYVRHSLYKESYGEHHLTSPKTKSSYRTLKIPQAVVDLIKNHKAWQDDYIEKMGSEYENSGIVFTNAHGGYLHSQYLNDNFKKILKKGDFPEGLHYHNLRHSCASLLIYNGVNATTVARQLGHSDTTTTLRIYTHAFDDAQAAAAQALETILIDKNSDENK
jgi:integrase